MTGADLVLRAIAAVLPKRDRSRYLEQWQADARDAPRIGIRPAAVLLGAAVVAVGFAARASREAKLRALGFAGMGCAAALSLLDAAGTVGWTIPLPLGSDPGFLQTWAARSLWAVLVFVALRLLYGWLEGAAILFAALSLTVLYPLWIDFGHGWTGDGVQAVQALVFVGALGVLVLQQRQLRPQRTRT